MQGLHPYFWSRELTKYSSIQNLFSSRGESRARDLKSFDLIQKSRDRTLILRREEARSMTSRTCPFGERATWACVCFSLHWMEKGASELMYSEWSNQTSSFPRGCFGTEKTSRTSHACSNILRIESQRWIFWMVWTSSRKSTQHTFSWFGSHLRLLWIDLGRKKVQRVISELSNSRNRARAEYELSLLCFEQNRATIGTMIEDLRQTSCLCIAVQARGGHKP